LAGADALYGRRRSGEVNGVLEFGLKSEARIDPEQMRLMETFAGRGRPLGGPFLPLRRRGAPANRNGTAAELAPQRRFSRPAHAIGRHRRRRQHRFSTARIGSTWHPPPSFCKISATRSTGSSPGRQLTRYDIGWSRPLQPRREWQSLEESWAWFASLEHQLQGHPVTAEPSRFAAGVGRRTAPANKGASPTRHPQEFAPWTPISSASAAQWAVVARAPGAWASRRPRRSASWKSSPLHRAAPALRSVGLD